MKRAFIILCIMASALAAKADEPSARRVVPLNSMPEGAVLCSTDFDSLRENAVIETAYFVEIDHSRDRHTPVSLYEMPYSWTASLPDWRRLWVNTGVYAAAMGGTLAVLESLPEDATSWNRAEIRNVPMFKRWRNHVLREGLNWDTDAWVFNYVLHPYAGAVYFMSARTSGFNFWQSMLYSSIISNVFWEFGIEAFMERPSIQDCIITPGVGSLIGEGFYRLKRKLVADDYKLWGSKVAGNIVAFFIDPVNELTGLFLGNPARVEAARRRGVHSSILPSTVNGAPGFTFSCTF